MIRHSSWDKMMKINHFPKKTQSVLKWIFNTILVAEVNQNRPLGDRSIRLAHNKSTGPTELGSSRRC